jgi:hypothetical protein
MAVHPRAARWRAVAPAFVLLAGAALGLGAPSASSAQAQTGGCETAQRTQGAFRSVPKPSLLPGSLTAHAVEPADPRIVYLADSNRVVGSRDAGCTWELVLELPSAPATSISSLTVPDADSPTGRLLVVSTTTGPTGPAGEASGAVSTVHSRLGDGQPFRQSAPVPGRVRTAVAAGDPDVVYLSTTDQGQAGLGPLRSTDGGASFTPTSGTRTYPPSDGGAVDDAPRHVAVDPDSRDRLLVASSSLQASADAGSTFGVVLGLADVRYAHALAAHGREGVAAGTVVLAATGNATTGLADGSAEIWSVPRTGEPQSLPTSGLLGVPQSLAAGQDADEVVLTVADLPRGVGDGYDGSGALYLLDAERQVWVDVMDRRGYPLLDAQVDRTADPAVHLHSSSLSSPLGADEYVVYDPPAEGRVVPPAPGEGSGTPAVPPVDEFPPPPGACPTAPVFEPPAARASASRLTPGQAQLPVDAAGATRHQLDLELAGDAAALDLVVLLDTSDSMGPAAEGIVCGLEGLVTGLAADGVDLRVGLAEFWDSAPGTRYQRLVDLAPPGRDLQRALRSVQTRGGEEAHRSALVQAVTGRGLVVGGGVVIRPGQGMTLREDALKVVLHVTDEPWSPQTQFEPSPGGGRRHPQRRRRAPRRPAGAAGRTGGHRRRPAPESGRAAPPAHPARPVLGRHRRLRARGRGRLRRGRRTGPARGRPARVHGQGQGRDRPGRRRGRAVARRSPAGPRSGHAAADRLAGPAGAGAVAVRRRRPARGRPLRLPGAAQLPARRPRAGARRVRGPRRPARREHRDRRRAVPVRPGRADRGRAAARTCSRAGGRARRALRSRGRGTAGTAAPGHPGARPGPGTCCCRCGSGGWCHRDGGGRCGQRRDRLGGAGRRVHRRRAGRRTGGGDRSADSPGQHRHHR